MDFEIWKGRRLTHFYTGDGLQPTLRTVSSAQQKKDHSVEKRKEGERARSVARKAENNPTNMKNIKMGDELNQSGPKER